MAQTRARALAGPIVAAAVAVALVAVGIVLVTQRLTADPSAADLERGALTAARTDVLALTTLNSKTADKQVQALLGRATPAFRDGLDGIATALERVVTQGQGSSTGKIADAGVASSDPGARTVTVLVAAEQAFAHSSRKYRLTMTMRQSGADWQIADLAFAS